MKAYFLELVQISLGTREKFSGVPSPQEWKQMFVESQRQTLTGICFYGVQSVYRRFPEQAANLPETLRLKWLANSAVLERRNGVMDTHTAKTLRYFREKGFPCMGLKGQGIAALYGKLGSMRHSGDIDVWLTGGRDKIYALSRKVFGTVTGANYHHIHFPMYEDVEVEAHIYPSFLSSPLRNSRLHRFCRQYQPAEGCADTPPLAFNRVFILLHCYRHVCGHGVGLRQLMDYYFVLNKGFTEEERRDTLYWCGQLGMGGFLKAAMWVMKYVFGLADEYLLCPPDAKEGKFLMSEIMHTGNMGHGEKRYKWGKASPLGRYIENQKRNMHLLAHYPHEVCWSPFFNVWRFVWLRCKGV